MIIKEHYLPKGHRNRPGNPMVPQGVLFHTTNNWDDKATDEMHGDYMEDTTRVVSWHDSVDADSVTHHIHYNENAWHAGDGKNGKYNRGWIGVEICCNLVEPGQPIDKATYNNAVEHIANLMIEFNFTWDQLQPHNIVYGKNCPHTSLFDRIQFKKDVFTKAENKKKEGAKPVKPKPLTRFTDVPVGHYAEQAIADLTALGIVSGKSETEFGFGEPVKREDVVLLLSRAIAYVKGGEKK